MNIWLIQIGEPTPISTNNPRLMRIGLLAELLVKQGHYVTWWSSNFEHATHNFINKTNVTLADNYQLKLLPSIGYTKNISLRRLLDHQLLAYQFAKQARQQVKPNIILSSLPTVALSYQAVKYAQQHNIPIILDLRDMWPDIFVTRSPKALQPAVKFLAKPIFNQMAYACRQATALTSITQSYINWGLTYAERKKNKLDQSFAFGYSDKIPTATQIKLANQFWQHLNIKSNDFVISFIGSFSKQMDFTTIIQATAQLPSSVKLVLAGDGPQLNFCKQLAVNHPNIIFSGRINFPQIWSLLRLSKLGIAPYINTADFTASIPNKAIEYLSAGLPIITSLDGQLTKLINHYKCGALYQNGYSESLVNLLTTLVNNNSLLTKLSNNAQQLYQQQFNAQQVYGKMVNHLKYIYETF